MNRIREDGGGAQSATALSTSVRDVPPHVEVPSIGLGTMRSSGTYIVLLLQLEREGIRAGILVQAAKRLGISLEELVDEYTDTACTECGVSILSHRKDGGRCP